MRQQEAKGGDVAAKQQDQKELGWDDVQPVDVIGLEVGYRLIPLVDQAQGGELLSRIKGVRKKLSQELGLNCSTEIWALRLDTSVRMFLMRI